MYHRLAVKVEPAFFNQPDFAQPFYRIARCAGINATLRPPVFVTLGEPQMPVARYAQTTLAALVAPVPIHNLAE